MLEKKDMDRLNELAKKKKATGLTEGEAVEQQQLRKAYLETFRAGMKETLEATRVIDPNGVDVTPEKIKAIQAKKIVQ